MPLAPHARATLQIHFCVLLWGFTPILGKLISLTALPLVWWRMLLVTVTLALLPRVWKGLRALPARMLWGYAGIGALVSLHWLTFYGAVKLANASVAATCIALAPACTSVIEPWLAKRPFSPKELFFGVATRPGVALVVGGVPVGMRAGVAVGALSALLVAVFGSLNKRMVEGAEPLTVTALELGSGTVLLTLLAPLMPWIFPDFAGDLLVLPSLRDAAFLLTLSLACTLLPFALSLVALRHLSAYGVQLITNLEPVYAIALAMLLFGEQRELTSQFYLGVAIILTAVFLQPLVGRRRVQHPEVLGTSESHHIVD
ncbi:MAG: DMT family transporter [Pseudoxanthomonas sp.]